MSKIWFNDINILFDKRNLFEILPHKDFDLNRKLNAIMRLILYYSLVMYILKKSKNILLLPIIVGIFTYIMNKKNKDNIKNENKYNLLSNIDDEDIDNHLDILKQDCRIPTKNNPFMNPLLTDFDSKNVDLKACDTYNNKPLQRVVEGNFSEDLYRDINDIFGKENSQRQFFTIPGKGVLNDQGSFAKWCYSTAPTCKEGNKIACMAGNGTTGVLSA
jgi:hypothetical protein